MNGLTDCVVTGDGDLLALHPFRGIKVLTDSFRDRPLDGRIARTPGTAPPRQDEAPLRPQAGPGPVALAELGMESFADGAKHLGAEPQEVSTRATSTDSTTISAGFHGSGAPGCPTTRCSPTTRPSCPSRGTSTRAVCGTASAPSGGSTSRKMPHDLPSVCSGVPVAPLHRNLPAAVLRGPEALRDSLNRVIRSHNDVLPASHHPTGWDRSRSALPPGIPPVPRLPWLAGQQAENDLSTLL